MKTIKIIGVPEHFNFPWIQLVQEQPLKEQGYLLEWTDESKGSGAMIKALNDKEADLAILLTESFIKDKTESNPGKIIGFHVNSPLTWGIHVPVHSGVNNISELSDAPFLISRYGSGSHLMAFLLAKQNNWDPNKLSFIEVGNMDGAKQSFEDEKPKAFLWEKYTTKPLVDQGYFKRIGEIPTPWPCFVIVVHQDFLDNEAEILSQLQQALYSKSRSLSQLQNLSNSISAAYSIQEEDIKAWLSQTDWALSSKMDKSTLNKTIDILMELGLINKKLPLEEFVDVNFAELI
ncbi:ABC transporter substrate-binding protein [Echinicola sp. CAU 1574]|uniref:ABC transporter substrate-binding protein n=1 Tax=Echinicola arenosa TaxID=2774144 RepID=A0ABR9AEL2_9BACT|nr:ABC transporter substrate-binding protein [Echinicola arenosa]MBD8487197.1 ABC transporter substrate-binding protein [Echinicola arenosa]